MNAHLSHAWEDGPTGSGLAASNSDVAWFCVRTQPRRESYAQTSLTKLDLEAFFPRIRYQGTGRKKGRWLVEPLFPNYLFCRFSRQLEARAVRYAPGVMGLIQFGDHVPVVPANLIEELKRTFGQAEPVAVAQPFKIGDHVVVRAGALQGSEGVIYQVLPNRSRVSLLLDFLGRQSRVEMDLEQIHFPQGPKWHLIQAAANLRPPAA